MAHVLVIEDNTGCQALASRMLTLVGKHDVVLADSPAAAMAAFAKRCPDLIVTDIALKSDVSGLDLIKKFKKVTHPPKIIAVSAFTAEFCEKEARTAGADAFLSKPYDPMMLVETVATLLAEK